MCGGRESEGAMRTHLKMAIGDDEVVLVGGRDGADRDVI